MFDPVTLALPELPAGPIGALGREEKP
jgi:hypothetical protein